MPLVSWPDELRLLFCLLLSAAVFTSAHRLARRCSIGTSQRLSDVLLIFFLVQYLSVCLPGIVGLLNVWTMAATALIACAVLWLLAGRLPQQPAEMDWISGRLPALAAALFSAGYLAAYAWDQRWIPPLATDALVYQLSTPVDWLRHSSITLFPTWYWNPANSYAPQCATSAFVWLMAPLGNDVLARWAQTPALLWVFLLCYRLGREIEEGRSPLLAFRERVGVRGISIGREQETLNPAFSRSTEQGSEGPPSFSGDAEPNRSVAAWAAAAAMLCRPLFSEAVFAKDDLFVTAFVAATVLALSRQNLRDCLGPWRLGIALGITLASKYTVLLVCPIFLFMIDAPHRAGWRAKQYAIALLTTAVLALPWYIRNFHLTGNPLYPVDVNIFGVRIFNGLFGTERDQQLRAATGIWHMLAATYHSLPTVLLALVGLLWLFAVPAAGRAILIDPLRRTCIVGSAAVLALFFAASPHHEVRYLFPLIVLWFAVAPLAIGAWLPARFAVAAAIVLTAVSVFSGFKSMLLQNVVEQAAVALVIAATGVGLMLLLRWRPWWRAPLVIAVMAITFPAAYVYWHAYVKVYREGCSFIWHAGYPVEAEPWQFIRDQIPADANVDFANTQFTYPLYGFSYDRDVAYAPTRRGLASFVDLPRLGDKVPGDLIVQRMTQVMVADPDRTTWLTNLRKSKARYLLVFRHSLVANPIELRFAAQSPDTFLPVFNDDAATVYRIDWPRSELP